MDNIIPPILSTPRLFREGTMRPALLLLVITTVGWNIRTSLANAQAKSDPLPSWNKSKAKLAIVDFSESATSEGPPRFTPGAERIAVFDNDGCLWSKNPVPFQLAFVLDRLQQEAPKRPEWKEDQFVRDALQGDLVALLKDSNKGLLHIIGLTHAGLTSKEFEKQVNDWIKTARHPRFNRPYDRCIYQPMMEVLELLRAKGFKTYIISPGGADFTRVFAERVYGIPPEQAFGSTAVKKYDFREGKPVLVKTLEHLFVDDKAGKPVGIHQFIGRQPVAAFGNSDGDKEMLEYTTIDDSRPSFGLLVHHTDAEREYAYDANPKSNGKLVDALTDAPQRG